MSRFFDTDKIQDVFPLVTNNGLSRGVGRHTFVKLEQLQRGKLVRDKTFFDLKREGMKLPYKNNWRCNAFNHVCEIV